MKKTLYDASSGTGTNYDRVIEQDPGSTSVTEDGKSLADLIDELYIQWYMKTGVYCKMDYITFLNQPYLAMKAVTKEIDKRIENYDEEILNYEHMALMFALSKLFSK